MCTVYTVQLNSLNSFEGPCKKIYIHKHLEDSYRKQAVNCPRKAQEAQARRT